MLEQSKLRQSEAAPAVGIVPTHPTFSIIIPCRNAARTLDETLQSVAAQSSTNWEAILVNDGSTDETGEILRRWAGRDPRFIAYDRANAGPSRSRNFAALECARGEYLAFLDADDLWAPHKLHTMSDILSCRPDLDGLYARVAFFRGSPETARATSKILPHLLSPTELLKENRVCTMSNLVVRAKRFSESGGLDADAVHGEDLEWLVRATTAGMRIAGVDQLLVYYRTSDNSLSADFERMHAGWRNAVASADKGGVTLAPRALRAAEAVHLRYLARRALRVRAPRFTALRFALRAVARSPSGFFDDPWRGGMTLLAACLEPFMPARLRRVAFSL
jgi:glycosyltransferase involved in cell wall biosynthesis